MAEAASTADAVTASDVLIIANGNPLSRRTERTAGAVLARVAQPARAAVVDLVTTAHPQHARQLAEQWAAVHPHGMIIAVGGDGTLNEVANGILGAGSPTRLAVCPAGNANDQHRSWPRSNRVAIERLHSTAPVPVDVLEVTYRDGAGGEPWRRYALSYVAVGVVATAATVINRGRRRVLANALVVPRALRLARPVALELDGRLRTLDSISWHVVPTMAKFLRVSSNARRDDGLMEVVEVQHGAGAAWLRMSWLAARALAGMGAQPQVAQMSFRWPAGGVAQLDGEPVDIPGGAQVTVRCITAAIAVLPCAPPRRHRHSGTGP